MKKWLIAIFAIVVIALTPLVISNISNAISDFNNYVTSENQDANQNTNTETETETEAA